MAKRPFEELIEFLERELDDRLRAVVHFSPAGGERLYARDDLALATDGELGDSFARRFPGADGPSDFLPRDPDGPDCFVGFGDETVELLLYKQSTEAVAVAFDRSDDGSLGSFAEQCLATLR